MKNRAVLILSAVATTATLASTFLEGKIIMDRDYAVNVTIMRWGSPDAGKTDEVIGQIASLDHRAATLVFDVLSATNAVPLQRLTIETGTQIYGPFSGGGYCVTCGAGHGTGLESNQSRGATTSGGCFFQLLFPRNPGASKMKLVNVLADGRPVKYQTKFNVSGDLLRSAMLVPKSKAARMHTPAFRFEDAPSPVPDAGATASKMRTWTGANGTTLQGEFVALDGASVELALLGGRKVSTPLANLSAADQEYVNSMRKIDAAATPGL